MSKAGKFIQEHTKKCSNVCSYNSLECEIPWLTPDQARKAVEIARKEMIDKACEWLKEIFFEYENLTDYNPTEDFKKYMKGE